MLRRKDTPMKYGRALVFGIPLALAACGGPLPSENASSSEVKAQSDVCLGATKTYGVDVSYYDGDIDWTQVLAAGKQFALIRVSDGIDFNDPQFASNWQGAKAAGLAVGAYQFFRP